MVTAIRLLGLIVSFVACTFALAMSLAFVVFSIATAAFDKSEWSALHVLFYSIAGILAITVSFSFPGLNAVRKRWGLHGSYGARALDLVRESGHLEQPDRRAREAETSFVLTAIRTVALVVLYLACGLLFGSAFIVFALGLVSTFSGVVIPSLGTAPVWTGASFTIATWFAFSGLNLLRTRWGISFKPTPHAWRHATIDFV